MRQPTVFGKSPLKAMSRWGVPVLLAVAFGAVSAQAQDPPPTIVRTIAYRQITNFQLPPGPRPSFIFRMRMSSDGSQIIFIAEDCGIFTINTDGTGLTQIRGTCEPGTTGVPFMDISADGSRIIWELGFNPVGFFVADSDGGNQQRIATAIPRPGGGTEGAVIGERIRITADGTQVYFLHHGSGPDVAGAYRINADGSGLTQLFSYRRMSQELFGLSGDEYNGNVAFTGDFAISADGSRMAFFTANFPPTIRTITFDGTSLNKVSDLGNSVGGGEGLIVISPDGSKIAAHQSSPEAGRLVVTMDFDGGNQVQLGDPRLLETPPLMGMTSDNSQVLIGVTGSYPVSLWNTDGSGRLDLIQLTQVNCFADNPFGRAGGDPTFSMTADGKRFIFKNELNFPARAHQIWVADINPDSLGDNPSISNVDFQPNFVLADGSTVSTFSASITGGLGGIRQACFGALQDNYFVGQYLSQGELFDQGGGSFTNNNVRNFRTPPDIGPLVIRLHALAGSLRQVTAVDATPFFVLSQPPAAPQEK